MPGSKQVCILGGTGFVGQHIVQQLDRAGHRIKIISRHRERKRDLLVLPSVKIVTADIHEPQVLKQQFENQDVVINLVGILNEFGNNTFQKVHVDLARKVADTCLMKQVPRLLHMSALNANANNGPSKYLRTKGQAENIVHSIRDVHVTSFQPSVIFGTRDDFFNRFARLLQIPPRFAPFPLACASAKFAPVFVEDLAQAFVKSLDDKQTYGQRYQLCGPQTYTLKELVSYTAQISGIRKRIIPLGNGLSKIQAMLLGLVPGKPFTMDNYLSTRADSVCDSNSLETIFGIKPRALESVVPHYLGKQSLRGRYSEFRRHSRRS